MIVGLIVGFVIGANFGLLAFSIMRIGKVK